MSIGKIIGKTSTKEFKLNLEKETPKFEYIKIPYKQTFLLAQIVEITRDKDNSIADCVILGYNKNNNLQPLNYPPTPGESAEIADNEFIKNTLNINKTDSSLYVGNLSGKDLKIFLDSEKLLTKHLAILAKTGAGKSYALSIILEELLEKGIPFLVIDPHGEYNSLKYQSTEKELLSKFNLEPKEYSTKIKEYSPDASNENATPFKISSKNLSPSEIIHLLPAKLSNAQQGILYSAIKNLSSNFDLDDLIIELSNEESNLKWGIINIIEYVKNLNLFSTAPTYVSELIEPNKASILNLRGTPPEIQEIIVHKLVTELFEERKKGNIPPFFLIVEEAHNFIPERTYGEAKSSSILRKVFSEGRKFGMGVAVVTQRPSRIEKNALSQVNTQIILRITNPLDMRAVATSVEGITSETEKEMRNLQVGTAIITGVLDVPLFVNIRPRKTKHGGETVQISTNGETFPLISSSITKQDIETIEGKVKTILIPCLSLTLNQNNEEFNLLVNLTTGKIITDDSNFEEKDIPKINFSELSPSQEKILNLAINFNEFSPAEIFSKSGMQFSEVYDILSILEKKKLIEKINSNYKIGKSLNSISNLKNLALFRRVDFKSVDYDEKLRKTVNPQDIIDIVKRTASIKNQRECFLVRYEKI